MLTVSTMVAEAKDRVENLTPVEVLDRMDRGALLIDIREEAELIQDGQIPGAVHAARGMLEFWADTTSPYHRAEFDPDRSIVLYCASGGRSALATEMLQRMGYERIGHLEGGLKRWKAEGRPVVHPS